MEQLASAVMSVSRDSWNPSRSKTTRGGDQSTLVRSPRAVTVVWACPPLPRPATAKVASVPARSALSYRTSSQPRPCSGNSQILASSATDNAMSHRVDDGGVGTPPAARSTRCPARV